MPSSITLKPSSLPTTSLSYGSIRKTVRFSPPDTDLEAAQPEENRLKQLIDRIRLIPIPDNLDDRNKLACKAWLGFTVGLIALSAFMSIAQIMKRQDEFLIKGIASAGLFASLVLAAYATFLSPSDSHHGRDW